MIKATVYEGNVPLMADSFADGTTNFAFIAPAQLTIQNPSLELEFAGYIMRLSVGQTSVNLGPGDVFTLTVPPGQIPTLKADEPIAELGPVPEIKTVISGLGGILEEISEIEEEEANRS